MNNSLTNDDVINLKELLNIILSKKIFLTTVAGFFSSIALFFSLTLPNIYQSSALLSPVAQSGISASMRNYSGLGRSRSRHRVRQRPKPILSPCQRR